MLLIKTKRLIILTVVYYDSIEIKFPTEYSWVDRVSIPRCLRSFTERVTIFYFKENACPILKTKLYLV